MPTDDESTSDLNETELISCSESNYPERRRPLMNAEVVYGIDSPEIVPDDQLHEMKGVIASPAVSIESFSFFSKFNSFRVIKQRITFYVLRCIWTYQKARIQREPSRYLIVGELRRSTEAIIHVVQLVHSAEDIQRVSANKP